MFSSIMWTWERYPSSLNFSLELYLVTGLDSITNSTSAHESEQARGDGEEQGRLTCCSPRGHKESDTT